LLNKRLITQPSFLEENMKQEIIVAQEKKEYVTPAISTVRLVAGEAVLGACKQNNGTSSSCTPTYPSCGPSGALS
jgi:hypothetical protein